MSVYIEVHYPNDFKTRLFRNGVMMFGQFWSVGVTFFLFFSGPEKVSNVQSENDTTDQEDKVTEHIL